LTHWETLLERQWPQNACDRSGECCRGAAQYLPWKNLLPLAAQGDITARAFLNQYIPYPDSKTAMTHAPHGVEASLSVARAKGYAEDDLVYYHCRFLKGKSECQIYEDRPKFCRTYPESPFGAIPSCCGYFSESQSCLSQIETMRAELTTLKQQMALP